MDNLKAQLSNLDFRYTDPYVGFDRRKVKGLVAKLVKIDPSVMDYTTALQICAEGRLYYVCGVAKITLKMHSSVHLLAQVVVDDNKVAADLLKNGKLKRKYTIIPLKQILAPDVDPRVCRNGGVQFFVFDLLPLAPLHIAHQTCT